MAVGGESGFEGQWFVCNSGVWQREAYKENVGVGGFDVKGKEDTKVCVKSREGVCHAQTQRLNISSAQSFPNMSDRLRPTAASELGVGERSAAKMAAAAPCQQATCRHLLLRRSDIVVNHGANNCCYSRRLTRREGAGGEGGGQPQHSSNVHVFML